MTDQTELSLAWRRRRDWCLRSVGICFIFPFILASSVLLAQPAQSATPQPTIHKKVVKRHSHRRRAKAAPPTQTVEVINGSKTQTTVFRGTPKTPAGANASRGHGSTGTKSAPKATTIEVTNGEKTQTQVFGATQPKSATTKAGKKPSSAGTRTKPSAATVEVINGTSEQTKVFSGSEQKTVQKTAPKPADSGTEPK